MSRLTQNISLLAFSASVSLFALATASQAYSPAAQMLDVAQAANPTAVQAGFLLAKNGADDAPGDDHGGRRGGRGGHGRGGHDDGPGHADAGSPAAQAGFTLAKNGADDAPGDDHGGRRGGNGGHGRGGHDDGPGHA